MAEYIKREDALIGLEESGIGFYDDEPIQTRNRALKIIQNIPAADVAPVVRGRWIDKNAGNATCSICKRRHKDVYDDDNSDSFFRSCGADMREMQDGSNQR